MSGTISKIRISEDNLEKLRILKNSLNLNSYEKVIDFLIDFNLKGNSEVNYLSEIKKTLEDGLSSNEKRTEAVHKRLGHLDKFYFTKILDTHHLLKEFLVVNLKEKNETKNSVEKSSDEQNLKLEKEVKGGLGEPS